MRRALSAMILGAALLGGACGSVESSGGTGGSGQGGTQATGGTGGSPSGTGGTAGTTGTGGQAGGGHGGSAGGGGHGGSGGHAGGGGHGGHAGAAGGAGGHAGEAGGPGGAGGAGGQHGDAGQTCDEIQTAFAQALIAALSCTPGAANQCAATALIEPLGQCPGCVQYVNDATTLNALRTQWDAQQCGQPVLCPAIACALPHPVTCAASDGSSGATCQSTLATTN